MATSKLAKASSIAEPKSFQAKMTVFSWVEEEEPEFKGNRVATMIFDLETYHIALSMNANASNTFECQIKPNISVEDATLRMFIMNAIISNSSDDKRDTKINIAIQFDSVSDFGSFRMFCDECEKLESKRDAPQLQIGTDEIEPGYVSLEMEIEAYRIARYTQPHIICDYTYLDSNDSQRTVLAMTGANGPFFLKVNRSHNSYRLLITVAIIDPTTQHSIYSRSNPLIIDVPNERLDRQWVAGQRGRLHFPTEKGFFPCRIETVLENKQYRVQCHNETHVVTSDRLKGSAKVWPQIIDLTNWLSVDRCLTIRGRDDESLCESVYHSMVTALSQSIYVAGADPNNFTKAVFIDASSAANHVLLSGARMIGIHVIDYLFPRKYKWRISCALCEQMNAIDCDASTYFEFKSGRHHPKYTANSCFRCMGEWIFMSVYNCAIDDHGTCCTDCFYGMVMKHRYWVGELSPLLQTRLNTDCILTLVSFIVGSVSLIKLE